MSKNFVKKGFTLIELLIVVVILGILATVVIAALNPVEAINKSSDTSLKNDAGTLATVLDSYYATYQKWPWEDTAAADTPQLIGAASPTFVVVGTTIPAWLTQLATSGEARTDFPSRQSHKKLKLFVDNQTAGQTKRYVLCFAPTSAAFITQARYNTSGQVPASGTPTDICLPE